MKNPYQRVYRLFPPNLYKLYDEQFFKLTILEIFCISIVLEYKCALQEHRLNE